MRIHFSQAIGVAFLLFNSVGFAQSLTLTEIVQKQISKDLQAALQIPFLEDPFQIFAPLASAHHLTFPILEPFLSEIPLQTLDQIWRQGSKDTRELIREFFQYHPYFPKLQSNSKEELTLLATLPFTHLDFSKNHQRLDDEAAELLSRSQSIQVLNARFQRITARGAAHLLKMCSLERLDLAGNFIGPSISSAFSDVTQLKELNLNFNLIQDEGVLGLAHLQLTHLALAGNQITDKGAQALRDLHQLVFLDLNWNQIGSNGMLALESLRSLRHLHLEDNSVGRSLVALRGHSQLETLNLSGNELDDEAVAVLGGLKNLTALNLSNNHIVGRGLRNLRSLKSLKLSYNQIQSPSLLFLRDLTELVHLDLYHNQIGDDELEVFRSLPDLRYLDLGLNEITKRGLHSFVDHPSLRILLLQQNRFLPKEAEFLRTQHLKLLELSACEFLDQTPILTEEDAPRWIRQRLSRFRE